MFWYAVRMKLLFSKDEKFINKFIYVAVVIYPLSTIPQIIDIFANRSAENVSLATWFMYDIITVIFLWYAIENKLKPLIIEYSLWLIAQSIVVTGILIY